MNHSINGRNGVALITIDVEPDNVWEDTNSKSIENIKHLPIFQNICDEFGMRPTYLVTWSVLTNVDSMRILDCLFRNDNCEIGIHPHLWEIPPIINIDNIGKATIGIDYDKDILFEKISNLIDMVRSRYGHPVSHRAGRWGIEGRQVKILTDLGVLVDTSIVPGVDWSSTGIISHVGAPLGSYYIDHENIMKEGSSNLLEVPCTIKPALDLWGIEKNIIINKILKKTGNGISWLRAMPNSSIRKMIGVCGWGLDNNGYINIMTHSSEFIENGSPYWRSDEDVKRHLTVYCEIFDWCVKKNVQSMTLKEFADSSNENISGVVNVC